MDGRKRDNMIKMLVISVGVLGGPVEIGKAYPHNTMEECNARIIYHAEKFDGDVKYHVDTKAMSTKHKGGLGRSVYRICVEEEKQ